MKTTKVIECPTCLNEQNDTCKGCNGSGLAEVNMTQDELNLADTVKEGYINDMETGEPRKV